MASRICARGNLGSTTTMDAAVWVAGVVPFHPLSTTIVLDTGVASHTYMSSVSIWITPPERMPSRLYSRVTEVAVAFNELTVLFRSSTVPDMSCRTVRSMTVPTVDIYFFLAVFFIADIFLAVFFIADIFMSMPFSLYEDFLLAAFFMGFLLIEGVCKS